MALMDVARVLPAGEAVEMVSLGVEASCVDMATRANAYGRRWRRLARCEDEAG